MVSSSTSSIHKSFKYDVFFSFRGEDTRKNFVHHLYSALQQKGIHTYKDDERINKGTRISDELMGSIEDSKFFIIVFSKNYASSSWCLNELLKIMECHKKTAHIVYPVFYYVEPSEIRNQTGAVGEAFARHEKEEATGKWRKALKEAADVAGWELKNTADGILSELTESSLKCSHEAKVIRQIVEKLSLELRSVNVRIDENLVGMKTRTNDIVSSLEANSDDVRMIGIWGIGGGGKTTLARAIYNEISFQFEGKSFIENIREVSNSSLSGLKSLQNQVLSDVLNDQDINVSSENEGKNMMWKMMRARKVLLVFDDIDHIDQLEALAGDRSWFKSGSIIIVTTRDEQVLVAHGVQLIHNVNLLSDKEAICLFNRYAFGREIPAQVEGYEELSRQVTCYAAGLPLTIKVLGSFLCGKSKLEWVDALARLKRIPLEETHKKLELSYNSLNEEYKEIFLDVATILKGWHKESVIKALESCGFHARICLRVLEQKSLITIDYNSKVGECVGMHDHIEEMGRNIVRRSHPDMPYKHSRLWIDAEIDDILANDLGSEATRCIKFYKERLNPEIVMKGLRKMKELRYLHVTQGFYSNRRVNKPNPKFLNAFVPWCIRKMNQVSPYFPDALQYLHWNYYPFRSLPKTFEANNLVALEMADNKMIQLWEGGEKKVLKKLRFLHLSGLKLRTFNLGLTPNLETLLLVGQGDLVELCMPVECQNLRSLKLSGVKLRTFDLWLTPNLEELWLKGGNLVELHMLGRCMNLTSLNLKYLKLRTLDLGLTPNLENLSIMYCYNLEDIHMTDVCAKLRSLYLEGSMLIRTLGLGPSPNLERLDIHGCNNLEEVQIAECPILTHTRISHINLRTLDLRLTPNLENLSVMYCYAMEDIHMTHECVKLRSLYLEGTMLRTFDLGPSPILERLDLHGCNNLEEIHIDECPILTHIRISKLKLRTLDLRLVHNLNKLHIFRCKGLVELHLDECQELKSLTMLHLNLRTLDLGLTPNIKKLDLEGCSNLLKLQAPNGCLKRLVYLKISGCLAFRSFLFRLKDNTSGIVNESPKVCSSAELHFTLNICPFHPDNDLLKFESRCFHKEDLPSLRRSLEKLISGGPCACTKLQRFSRSISLWATTLNKA